MIGWAALALGIIVATLLIVRLMFPGISLRRTAAPATSLQLPPVPLPESTAQPEAPLATPDALPLTSFSHKAMGELTHFRRPFRIIPPFAPVDGRSFRAEGHSIVLAHIDAPAVGAVCFDDERRLWPCGHHARVGLYNIIRNSALACQPLSPGGAGAAPMLWTCTHEGQDLARLLIQAGWARPLGTSPLDYLADLDEAQRSRRGLWNGGWTLNQTYAAPPTAPAARKRERASVPREE